jgi:hypothetical protein
MGSDRSHQPWTYCRVVTSVFLTSSFLPDMKICVGLQKSHEVNSRVFSEGFVVYPENSRQKLRLTPSICPPVVILPCLSPLHSPGQICQKITITQTLQIPTRNHQTLTLRPHPLPRVYLSAFWLVSLPLTPSPKLSKSHSHTNTLL